MLTVLSVLPPISTEGLGPDDVTALSEKTREQMLEALVDISAPGPSQSQTPSSSKPTPAAQQENETRKPETLHLDISKEQASEGIRRRANNGSDGSSSSADSPIDSAGKSSEAGKSESTEDEMDGDAVLLSRP
jgi:lysophosphatidate acyltransferase